IAMFPITGEDPTPACGSALTAAQTALAALQAAPKEIQQHISIDIALHYGDVAYGNIGSGNRLDFTAVGRDVNILSRLELLCKDVGRPLLMTDTFAVEVAEPVIEIGHFELRGFRRHQAASALCQEGEPPCRPKVSVAGALCNNGTTSGERLRTFAVITTDANELVAEAWERRSIYCRGNRSCSGGCVGKQAAARPSGGPLSRHSAANGHLELEGFNLPPARQAAVHLVGTDELTDPCRLDMRCCRSVCRAEHRD